MAGAILLSSNIAASGEAKDDFRGIRLGYTFQQASQAASTNGGRCEAVFPGGPIDQVNCNFGSEARARLFFTPKEHVYLMRVIFFGNFDDSQIQQRIVDTYSLVPDENIKGSFYNNTGLTFSMGRMASDAYSVDIANRRIMEEDLKRPSSPMPRF